MNKDYIALFKVLYVDANGNDVEDCGFCFANSFIDVVKYLEDTLYGTDLIEIRHIELIEACPIVSEETWETLRKELNAE
jgi:hypothetical protein